MVSAFHCHSRSCINRCSRTVLGTDVFVMDRTHQRIAADYIDMKSAASSCVLHLREEYAIPYSIQSHASVAHAVVPHACIPHRLPYTEASLQLSVMVHDCVYHGVCSLCSPSVVETERMAASLAPMESYSYRRGTAPLPWSTHSICPTMIITEQLISRHDG